MSAPLSLHPQFKHFLTNIASYQTLRYTTLVGLLAIVAWILYMLAASFKPPQLGLESPKKKDHFEEPKPIVLKEQFASVMNQPIQQRRADLSPAAVQTYRQKSAREFADAQYLLGTFLKTDKPYEAMKEFMSAGKNFKIKGELVYSVHAFVEVTQLNIPDTDKSDANAELRTLFRTVLKTNKVGSASLKEPALLWAQQGNPEGMIYLASYYERSGATTSSLMWYRKAALRNKHAAIKAAEILSNKRTEEYNIHEAVELLNHPANLTSHVVLALMADILIFNEDIRKDKKGHERKPEEIAEDLAKGHKWLNYLKLNFTNKTIGVKAFTLLARCHQEGRGCTVNLTNAVGYFNKAIKLGDTKSFSFMGKIYMYHWNQKKEGADWFNDGYQNGDLTSTHELALVYLNGSGRDRDYDRAVGLFQESARGGYVDSITWCLNHNVPFKT